MQINFESSVVRCQDGKTLSIDKLKAYLLLTQRTLCHNCYLSCIKRNGKTIFTYDWKYIIYIAKQSGAINEETISWLINNDMPTVQQEKKAITLKDIEDAIKPNFVFDNENPKKRLNTAWKIEGIKSMAVIVFIGIAHFNGFKKEAVINFLEIRKADYDIFLVRFLKYWNEGKALELNPGGYDEDDHEHFIARKLVVKYDLVINALRLSYPKNSFLTMADFGD